jgi:phenylalanyl-tRNA synthetase beta chain
MKIPLSWLKEFITLPAKITLEQISQAFVKVGFEIESIEEQGADLKGPLVVGKVLSIEELSEHKKPIRFVGLDVGEKKTRYIICGARNFKVNDLVVVALPGALLPGDFKISARETYGKISDGMICSAKEIGISDEHAGIIVLQEGKIGQDAIALLDVRDVIFDVSVNPDRGYAMSVRGLARELAGSLQVKYVDPADPKIAKKFGKNSNPKAVSVKIEDKSGADQIYIRTLDQVNVKKSTPLWMQRRIEKCGMRSISLAVDITNYVMLELGQPLHAFDAQYIMGGLRVVRAGKFTKLTTLDKVDRKLDPDNLLIADAKTPLALAGTMGGLTSEVSNVTTKIALEAAHFDPLSISRNSRSHNLSSEASRRMERNTDPALAEIASARATQLLIDLADAKYVGTSQAGSPIKNSKVKISQTQISKYLGFPYTAKQVKSALLLIGCKVAGSADLLTVEVPTWRPDLINFADFAEEIARLNSYDLIPATLPTGKNGARLNDMQYRKRAVAISLANQGFTEVINYPFVSQEMVDLLGFTGDRAKSFKIANPMSEEFPLLRTHLLPGLLTTAVRNIGRGSKNLAIFEIGTIFRNTTPLGKAVNPGVSKRPSEKVIKDIYDGVPKQMLFVGAVVTGETVLSDWQGSGSKFNWSDAIAKAQEIIESTGNDYEILSSDLAPWHPGRCAELRVNGKPIAHAGELHPRVITALNLPERSCAFAVILSELPSAGVTKAPAIWSFPAVVQDVALVVESKISAADLTAAIKQGAGPLLESIVLFDRYDQIAGNKVSLAFTLTFRASDRTLTSDEVALYRDQAIAQAAKSVGAVLRGNA